MKNHKRLHTGEKPYKCSCCEMYFRQPSVRSKHKFTRTRIRDYVCTVCNKKLTRSDKLKVHMKRHLDLKDHVCEKCQKGFVESADLRRHKCMPMNENVNKERHNSAKKTKNISCTPSPLYKSIEIK